MSSRWTGFFIWALVAASTAFWGIKIFAATRPVPAGAVAPQVAFASDGPMDRLFGAVVVPTTAVDAPPPESSRYQLVGVIAAPGGGAAGGSLAIVAIDGQPARSWHVGATLDGNTTLLAVARRTADFGPAGGPSAFTLQLPEPTAAATGTLPTVTPAGGNGFAPQAQIAPGAVTPAYTALGMPSVPFIPPGNGQTRPPMSIRSSLVPPGRAPMLAAPTIPADSLDPRPADPP